MAATGHLGIRALLSLLSRNFRCSSLMEATSGCLEVSSALHLRICLGVLRESMQCSTPMVASRMLDHGA